MHSQTSSAPILNIASNATNVHLHFHNHQNQEQNTSHIDAQTQQTQNVSTSSTIEQDRTLYPLSRNTNSTLSNRFEQLGIPHTQGTRQQSPPIQNILRLFRNILSDEQDSQESIHIDRTEQRVPEQQPIHTTHNAHTQMDGTAERNTRVPHPETPSPDTTPSFQSIFSRSVSMRDMLQRLRTSGQRDTPIAVSFEVIGPSTSTSSPVGLTIQELNEYTTLGLYEDIPNTEQTEDVSTDVSTECCSICQEQINSQSIIRQVDRCGHVFHHECIEKWLSDHRKCPLCMQNVIQTDDEAQNTTATDTNTEPTSSEERLFNLVASELGI